MTLGPFHLIANVFGRKHQSLNGIWHTIVDPYENGYYDYRYEPLEESYGSNMKPKDEGDRIEYDFDQSPTLKVPGDWNSQRPELGLYEGTVWYKTSFPGRRRRASDRRAFLHFGAANYEAIVYVNGKCLGKHVGGFTPFEFELGEVLVDGENTVIVKVDDQRRRDGVPTVNPIGTTSAASRATSSSSMCRAPSSRTTSSSWKRARSTASAAGYSSTVQTRRESPSPYASQSWAYTSA
jgi:beta-glucuronidase